MVDTAGTADYADLARSLNLIDSRESAGSLNLIESRELAGSLNLLFDAVDNVRNGNGCSS